MMNDFNYYKLFNSYACPQSRLRYFSTKNNLKFRLIKNYSKSQQNLPTLKQQPLVLQTSFAGKLNSMGWFFTSRSHKYTWLRFILYYYHRIVLSRLPRRFRRKFPRHLRTKRLRSFAAWLSPTHQLIIFTRLVLRFFNTKDITTYCINEGDGILILRQKTLQLVNWFHRHISHFFFF